MACSAVNIFSKCVYPDSVTPVFTKGIECVLILRSNKKEIAFLILDTEVCQD